MKTATGVDYVQVVRYYMAKDENKQGHADFGHVFHHVDVLEDTQTKTSEIQMGPERFPQIKLNPDFFEKGTLDWSVEVLKHNLWHLLCGHLEKRVDGLISHYGDERVQAAADLVVNQHADPEAYKSAGVPLITPDVLQLESEQAMEYYISELKDIPKSQWPVDIGSITANATQADVQHFVQMTDASGKLAGKLPGEAEEYIEQLMAPPKVDWDYYLREKEGHHRSKVTHVTKNRPSRRCDFHLGRKHIGMLNVAFIIDTSGSMSRDTLSQTGSEIDGIAERGAEVMIMHVDYDVAQVIPYEIGMELGEFYGRGGTRFEPAFEKLQEMEWQPDFVVYFTDGYGSAPDKMVFDTLWVLVEAGMEVDEFRSSVCDWGTTVKIKGNPLL